MQKKYLILFLFLLFIDVSFAQYKKLSPTAEISIITAGPGKELYEGFGHSTIRVKDINYDYAYNYGIFDFNAPNFYLNFAKGKLLYKLESYPFYYFVKSYQKDQRWIKEQVLNLNQQEKQQFFEYLENNAKPQNATYLYDPFYNNCASVIRDITELILKNKVQFNDSYLSKKQSFRELMNDQLPWNTWGSFGINLALGSKLDKITTEKEHMYLPDYVYSGFKTATINRDGKIESLIKKETKILKFKELEIASSFFSPLFIFIIILLVGSFITIKDLKRRKRTKPFDFILAFTSGLIGLVIVFLWFFTNHSTTPNNFNFLWAFAPNILIAFYLKKKTLPLWIKTYFKLLLIMLLLIVPIWVFKIQELPIASIPLLILMAIRYFSLSFTDLLSEELWMPF